MLKLACISKICCIMNIPKRYNHKEVEEKWYKFWEENGFFKADPNDDTRPRYTISMPPPNVTGIIHIGHVLNNTLQDILIRWRRLQGFNVLWQPGTDHAGIATQNVVEKELAKEGKTRFDVGREEFVRRVWKWKEEYGSRIINQLKRLGVSADWSRAKFTMDPDMYRAVIEAFVRLFEKGLIYRGVRIINWCPRCGTALADDEVEHEEHDGHLWYIRYPLVDEPDRFIVVATTRPETYLGDTAVAVHPDDKRYKHLIGKKVRLPMVDWIRKSYAIGNQEPVDVPPEIPIIADELVDPEFGTGAVKVTPAHDPNDYEMGMKHNLPFVLVMDKDARMNENAGPYRGMDRYEARERIVEELKQLNFIEKIEAHKHSVGHCYRCHTVIEPYLSEQWFINIKELAKPALKVVEEGKIRFHPERWVKTYRHWLENIRPWCISRQLWWGHRIPVWYCDDCGEVIVAKEDPTKCPKCQSTRIRQDEDVLDTWASSWLWPFSTLGWPNDTEDLKYFYPTDDLVTGPDIIFFWVARMIMAGLEFMGDIPFTDVYFTGMIRDMKGRKMSKSLGNSPDPLDVIAEYGADALRFTISYLSPLGQDIYYSNEKCEMGRNFANKIWNASRFLLMNLEDYDPNMQKPKSEDLTLADKWILSEFNKAVKNVNNAFKDYNFTEAAKLLHEFIWRIFCDWYVELIKHRLYRSENQKDKAIAQYMGLQILEGSLRLLHPIMPFITEEIWQKLPNTGESIMIAEYPQCDENAIDEQSITEMNLIMDIIGAIRNIRGEMNVPPSKKANVIFKIADDAQKKLLLDNQIYIMDLGKMESVIAEIDAEKPKASASAVVSGIEIYIPLKGVIDLELEEKRLSKEIEKAKIDVMRAEKKLNNENFTKKAPANVVQKEQEKLELYKEHLAKLEKNLDNLK